MACSRTSTCDINNTTTHISISSCMEGKKGWQSHWLSSVACMYHTWCLLQCAVLHRTDKVHNSTLQVYSCRRLVPVLMQQCSMLSSCPFVHVVQVIMRTDLKGLKTHVRPAQPAGHHSCHLQEKKRKVYVVRRHDGSLCTQKQPETAALRAAIKKSDPMGGQPFARSSLKHT